MRLTAEELHARGVELSNSGRLIAAMHPLRAAMSRADSLEQRARIAGTLAYVVGRTGQLDEAERICHEILGGTHGETISPETAAVLQGQLGVLAVNRGDFEASLEWLGHAISAEADVTRLANTLSNRGVALMWMGRLSEAAADLDRAARSFGAVGENLGRAMTVHNAGYAALLAGDLVVALERMAEARPVAAASSPVNAAICDLDRAQVLREAGQLADAERTLASVARSFGTARMPQSRAEAEFHLAQSLVTHDQAAAAEVAGAAARRFRGLGSTVWAARAEGVRQRALLEMAKTGRRRPSAEQVRGAASELDRVGFASEAQMLRLSHRIARARGGDIDPTPIRLRPADTQPVRLLVHQARAVQAAARGRDAAARRHAAAGLESLAAWQRSFGALDVASSVAMHGNGLMFEGLGAAIRSRRPEVVFDWSEQARHFAHQVAPVRPPRDPEHAADLARLRLLREETGTGWDTDPRVRDLRERIRERQWATAGEAEGVPRVGIDTLRAALDDETALLTFVYARGTLVCLAVPASGDPTIVDIDAAAVLERMPGLRADLDVAAAVGAGPMARLVGAALERRLVALSQLLVERALVAAGDPRRVLITSPGILAGLPWTMLPAMRGRSVSLARSASRWVDSRSRRRKGHTAGFAVGPGIARGPEEAEAAAFSWELNAAGLGVASTTPVLVGQDATVSAVTDLAERVDVLHLVAHGRHSIDAPLLSGLSFADGVLFGYDIDLIDRMPKTVILSACELGRSSVRWGAEAIGMAHAWLHAGAVCVIAAPVTVADDAAAELLGALHGSLAAGLAPADALTMAAQETGIVAPFVCHGSGF